MGNLSTFSKNYITILSSLAQQMQVMLIEFIIRIMDSVIALCTPNQLNVTSNHRQEALRLYFASAHVLDNVLASAEAELIWRFLNIEMNRLGIHCANAT